MRWASSILLTAALALAALAACSARRNAIRPPSSRQATLDGIARIERDLGYGGTGNFRHYSDTLDAYYRCYYTGRFELPRSYEGLRHAEGTADGCSIDESSYDVFFYPIEAVAGTNTPVSTALEEATDPRFSVVVAHEDFHEMSEIQDLPTRFSEAAATLVGFLTAAEHARREYGPDGDAYLALAREAEVYLRKSEIVNRYHEEVARLYRDLRAGNLTEPEAATDKERLYRELRAACEAISPAPSSFNQCPAALNNAGLAFDVTYTRFYPLLYQVHVALGRNLRATADALREPAGRGIRGEAATARYFEQLAAVEGGRKRSGIGW